MKLPTQQPARKTNTNQRTSSAMLRVTYLRPVVPEDTAVILDVRAPGGPPGEHLRGDLVRRPARRLDGVIGALAVERLAVRQQPAHLVEAPAGEVRPARRR